MKAKRYDTLGWKLAALSLAAFALTGLILMVFYYGASLLLWLNPSRSFFGTRLVRWTVNHIGSPLIMLVGGLPTYIYFFFLFTKNTIGYLREITTGMQEFADGDLSYTIPVSSADELGTLAKNMNTMADKLRLSLEEERASAKAKNDLITGVSHDLRTPLTSVIGFLEYIETDRYRDEIELRYYVNIAYEKSLTLKKLIDELFEYTRVSGGSLPLELEPVDLGKLLTQLAEEFVPSLEQADMSYRVRIVEPVRILADTDELVRLYENLFSNAIRYGKDGKRLDITIGREDDEAVVICTNYGTPIPAEDVPHLFERFYRVDKSRSKETGGTGLGLAITKSITELHDGRISVRSNRRQTDFETRFPLYHAL
ncbi:sensor histidine kinase [Paenibacillus polymyxa]|uniref:histidine kinase n=1 Tax=Paenibacillus polymyxa TaxID=1406 RepID=A0AAE9IGD5_PAEPO|nr:HAMP domain-containing sensor histidine kinase [Paenibacillus polymyxa]URJ52119.1 HAMP domain-containing sensor histidine kinase [Paenibacillus polymyxa]